MARFLAPPSLDRNALVGVQGSRAMTHLHGRAHPRARPATNILPSCYRLRPCQLIVSASPQRGSPRDRLLGHSFRGNTRESPPGSLKTRLWREDRGPFRLPGGGEEGWAVC